MKIHLIHRTLTSNRFAELLYGNLFAGLGYFLTAKLLQGISSHAFIIPLWLPAGVALASVLFFGRSCLPGLILGGFATKLAYSGALGSLTFDDWVLSLITTAGGVAQAVIAARMIKDKANPLQLDDELALFQYVFFAGLITCMLNATIGSVTLAYLHPETSADLGHDWVIWWIGDAFGAISFTPLVLLLLIAFRDWRTRNLTLVVQLLGIVAVSFLGNFAFLKNLHDHIANSFQHEVKILSTQLQAAMDHNFAELMTLEQLVITNPDFGWKEFDELASSLYGANGAALAYSWDPIIWASERREFEQITRRELDIPEFAIRGASIGGPDQATIPVQYVSPLNDQNFAALGFNLLSLEDRLESVLLSQKLGRSVITKGLRLKQAPTEPGFLILHPVYVGTEAIPQTELFMRVDKTLRGYMVGVYTLSKMLTAIRETAETPYLKLRLSEVNDTIPILEESGFDPKGQFVTSLQINVAQRQWLLEVSADNEWVAHQPQNNALTTHLMIFISGVLATLVLLGMHNREKILQSQIQVRTAELRNRSRQDALTKLPNRLSLEEQLSDHIHKHSDTPLHLFFLDLDRFKLVNDSLGHTIGDKLLVTLAQKMQTFTKARQATLFRMGGDEFVILAKGLEPQAIALAEDLLKLVSSPLEVGNTHLHVTASIGISTFPQHGDKLEELVKHADTAMYKAKDEGKNRFQFYSPNLTDQALMKLTVEQDMRSGLAKGQFFLVYQPQFTVKGGRFCGVEALVRWRHPTLGLVSPGEFIPIAEETLLIIELGWLVLRQACEQQMQWRQQGIHVPYIAVNISPRQLLQADFVERVVQQLNEFDLPHSDIELEITETPLHQDPDFAIQQLNRLKEEGFRLALDDFGTGYSSMNRMKRLPIDRLKIDQGFIQDIGRSTNDEAVVLSIIDMGQRMNMEVLAEGVESQEQLDFLASSGCDSVQGYYLGRPADSEKLVELLQFAGHFEL